MFTVLATRENQCQGTESKPEDDPIVAPDGVPSPLQLVSTRLAHVRHLCVFEVRVPFAAVNTPERQARTDGVRFAS